LLGSGTILREVIAAADLLESDWKIAADVWSVTSFSEMRRDGLQTERNRRLPTDRKPQQPSDQQPWVEQCLGPTAGPIIAASDYVTAVADLIRTWVPRRYVVLGTDGFGRSDTRASLRKFFGVDRMSIAFAAIRTLMEEGSLKSSILSDFKKRYDCMPADF
jgi:pyruvate dehydrogenase E1 component